VRNLGCQSEFERKIKAGIEQLETPEIQAEITYIVTPVMTPRRDRSKFSNKDLTPRRWLPT
jgi:type III restriction enzyme